MTHHDDSYRCDRLPVTQLVRLIPPLYFQTEKRETTNRSG